MKPSLRQVVRGIAVAAVSGLALSACGAARPGAAASIDADQMSVQELQTQNAEYFADYPQARGQVDPSELNSALVENFLRVRIVDNMGEEFGVVPTQGELETFVNERFGGFDSVLEQMSGVGIPSSRPDLAWDYLRFVYIENAVRDIKREELGLAEDDPDTDEVNLAVTAEEDRFSQAADISVNPRFGVWDGSFVASSVESGSGSISIPAPLPTQAS